MNMKLKLKRVVILFLIFSSLICSMSFAQVCNTGQVLSRGRFNLSLTPLVLVGGDNRLGLFTQFGFGAGRSVDIGMNLRFAENTKTVFGVDIEFALLHGTPALSLTTGAHVCNAEVGIDGTINLTFTIQNTVSLFGGLNADIDFRNNDTYIPLWGFFGTEVKIKRSLGIIIEIDLDILDNAPHIFSSGIAVYF